jgi:sodium bicarbonate cotransporter 8
LDLLIIALCVAVNSIFGLPFYVGATVLSMNHVIALRKTANSSVPGVQAKVVGVIEQRVTGFVVFILIGCSLFITDLLGVSLHWIKSILI